MSKCVICEQNQAQLKCENCFQSFCLKCSKFDINIAVDIVFMGIPLLIYYSFKNNLPRKCTRCGIRLKKTQPSSFSIKPIILAIFILIILIGISLITKIAENKNQNKKFSQTNVKDETSTKSNKIENSFISPESQKNLSTTNKSSVSEPVETDYKKESIVNNNIENEKTINVNNATKVELNKQSDYTSIPPKESLAPVVEKENKIVYKQEIKEKSLPKKPEQELITKEIVVKSQSIPQPSKNTYTQDELEIIRLYKEGYSIKDISNKLLISRSKVSSIIEKQ